MVVIGVGSPFLSDDSIGPRLIRKLRADGGVHADLLELNAGGLLTLEALEGFSRAVIVDALVDKDRNPGEIVVSTVTNATNNASCSHDCSLSEAFDIARTLNLQIPDNESITIVGVVAADLITVSDRLTPSVEAVLDELCEVVRKLVSDYYSSSMRGESNEN